MPPKQLHADLLDASPGLLIFDITDLVNYGRRNRAVSGIQRGAIEIIRTCLRELGDDKVCLAYLQRRRGFWALRGPVAKQFDADPLAFVQQLVLASKGPVSYLRGPRPFRDVRTVSLRKVLQPGSCFINLGGNWGLKGYPASVERLSKRYKVAVYQMVCDLIPLLQTQHLAFDFSEKFLRWLKHMSRSATKLLAISQSTQRDLKAILHEQNIEVESEVVPLAIDFSGAGTATNKAIVSSQIPGTPYVLVVGTMESRKNIYGLALVWQNLISLHGIAVPKLVFAGKLGWGIDDFLALMTETNWLNGHVIHIDRPDDAILSALYTNCQFTAMVSHYEGWGLPIGEGLFHGKTGVVADNSAMPEVGGDLVLYCQSDQLDSIQAACERLIFDPKLRKDLETKIRSHHFPTWRDVAANLISKL